MSDRRQTSQTNHLNCCAGPDSQQPPTMPFEPALPQPRMLKGALCVPSKRCDYIRHFQPIPYATEGRYLARGRLARVVINEGFSQ